MSGQKRFGASLFGFKKSDVNNYIERILEEFDSRLKEKDKELDRLREKNREITLKYDELSQKASLIEESREKIAGVLIKAEEKAESMLVEAQEKAMEEKARIEKLVEEEKEKLIDVKRELKVLKEDAVNTLNKYQTQMQQIINE